MAKRARLVWAWTSVFLLLLSGTLTLAQDGEADQPLWVNDLSAESDLSTSQETLGFFAALDGLEPIMNSVVEIKDQ